MLPLSNAARALSGAQFLAESKLGSTVSKLSKFEHDASVKDAAAEVKKLWAARAAAAKEVGKKAADASAKSEPMDVAKSEAPAPPEAASSRAPSPLLLPPLASLACRSVICL